MKSAIVIVIGPSGSGKSSFVEKAITEVDYLEDIITYTTRSMREGESEGHPYHFIDRTDFEQKIENGFFAEWAEVHGNLYGSSNEQFIAAWQREKVIIMDVDVQGALTIKKKYPQAFCLFIKPPNLEELRKRVAKRDGQSKDLEVRMQNAEKEMLMADQFDAQLINDEFQSSYLQFKKMIEEYVNSK